MKKRKQLSSAFLSWLIISLLLVTGLNSCLKPDDPADGKEDPNKPGEFDPTLRVTTLRETAAFPADTVLPQTAVFPADTVLPKTAAFPADTVLLEEPGSASGPVIPGQ